MRKRIFWAMLGLSVLMTALFALLVNRAIKQEMLSMLGERLSVETRQLAERLQGGETDALSQALTDARITLVAPDGAVLFDSQGDSERMENHLQREEVQQALAQGTGSAVRYSPSLKVNMVYWAQKMQDGTVLRLSAPERNALKASVNLRTPLLAGLVLFTLLAFALSTLLSRGLLKPIDRIDMTNPVDTCPYEELLPLSRRIAAQQEELKKQLHLLEGAREETETVLNAMSEGFIIFGGDENVLSINRSACALLGVTAEEAVGKPLAFMNRSPEMLGLLETMREKGAAQTTLSINRRYYEARANAVSPGERGAVLLLNDVTDRMEGEEQRKRFTANVSHELRTPLTAILGYTELLDSGMARQEDQSGILARIRREGERLLRLIEDVLKLSQMDEGRLAAKREQVCLKSVLKKTALSLEDAAGKKQVRIEVLGDDGASVQGNETLLEEMIYNLLDNAVKYNVPGGLVEGTVRAGQDTVTVAIRDTGIGIEKEHQEKVFDRFYRTDKSRSRETGGTGLGLSIVKHAAEYHGANVRLSSTPGQGTLVEVIFPRA